MQTIQDRRWTELWALSKWIVVCSAWSTVRCHRSVTRTTTVLLTTRVSSTHMTLHSSPTPPTLSLTAPGPGGILSSALSNEQHKMSATVLESQTFQRRTASVITTVNVTLCTHFWCDSTTVTDADKEVDVDDNVSSVSYFSQSNLILSCICQIFQILHLFKRTVTKTRQIWGAVLFRQTWSNVHYIWQSQSAHFGKWCPCEFTFTYLICL